MGIGILVPNSIHTHRPGRDSVTGTRLSPTGNDPFRGLPAPLPRLSISNCCRSPISYPFGVGVENQVRFCSSGSNNDWKKLFYEEGHWKKLHAMGRIYPTRVTSVQYLPRRNKYMNPEEFMLWLKKSDHPTREERVYTYLRRNNIFVAENSADFLLKDPVEDIAYKPPPSGVIKVHIDGAFYQEKKEKGLNVLDKEGSSGVKRMGGWGAVYRDDTKITKILGGHLPDVKNAYEAEVEALYHALLGAKDLEYTDIVVQSDCQNLVTVINKDIKSTSEYAIIYGKIKELKEGFTNCAIEHCYREENKLANYVARIKMNEKVTDQKIVDMLEREDMQAASATTEFRIVQKKKKKID